MRVVLLRVFHRNVARHFKELKMLKSSKFG